MAALLESKHVTAVVRFHCQRISIATRLSRCQQAWCEQSEQSEQSEQVPGNVNQVSHLLTDLLFPHAGKSLLC